MVKLEINGWTSGFRKISLTKFLQQRANYSLAQAKAVTDTVLSNQPVTIEVAEDEAAQATKELVDIGVFVSQR
jgi:ribosomal protein L7/L12